MPQLDRLSEKGYDVLFLTDDVDEFTVTILHEYSGKQFKSVSSGDLDIETEEEKKASEKLAEDHKPLLDEIKEALAGKVKDVKISSRLKDHAVCISSEGPLSVEMEKVLNAMPTENKLKAERILEINSEHPVFAKLKSLHENGDKQKLKDLSDVLFVQAQLIEGILPEDPADYVEKTLSMIS